MTHVCFPIILIMVSGIKLSHKSINSNQSNRNSHIELVTPDGPILFNATVQDVSHKVLAIDTNIQ
jgi:hypothetical protein